MNFRERVFWVVYKSNFCISFLFAVTTISLLITQVYTEFNVKIRPAHIRTACTRGGLGSSGGAPGGPVAWGGSGGRKWGSRHELVSSWEHSPRFPTPFSYLRRGTYYCFMKQYPRKPEQWKSFKLYFSGKSKTVNPEQIENN